jgi:methylsterol monooxygenase
MNTWQVPFPDWPTAALQVALFFVFEDAFHFFAHRALHYGPLYKHIHKVHHKYSAPFGLAAEYAHPAEVFILGMGTIGGPLLYCLAGYELHMITVLVWVTLKLFQAVDAHSGYGKFNKVRPKLFGVVDMLGRYRLPMVVEPHCPLLVWRGSP